MFSYLNSKIVMFYCYSLFAQLAIRLIPDLTGDTFPST